MKIAYILPTLQQQDPTEGGHSQQFHIINELLQLGHQVTVYARTDSPAVVFTNDLSSWQSVDLKLTDSWIFNKLAGATWKLQRGLGVPYLNVFRSVRMLEACMRVLPDYELCFERVGLYSVAPALASRWRRIPYVLFFDADGIFELDYAGTPVTGIQRRVLSWMQRTSLRQAERVICVSEVSAKQLVNNWHIDARKVNVLANAVDTQQFHPFGLEDSCQVRTDLGLPQAAVITMFVGSFQSWHDWRSLIHAFQAAMDDAGSALLILVGAGPGIAQAKALVQSLGLSKNVVFLGAISHEKVNEVLSVADIVVAPYPKDSKEFWGSPMKIFEYMAAGKAIVAASVGQLSEVLEHGVTALLYSPSDIAELTANLVTLSESPTLRQELGAQARQKAVREHSWDRYIKVLDQIMQDAISARLTES